MKIKRSDHMIIVFKKLPAEDDQLPSALPPLTPGGKEAPGTSPPPPVNPMPPAAARLPASCMRAPYLDFDRGAWAALRAATPLTLGESDLAELLADQRAAVVVGRDRRVGGAGLDEKAIEAVRQWRFSPAKRQGAPVDVIVEVSVEFKLR